MAYDGITAAAVVKELNDKLLTGSIVKIAQPEKDELLLTLKCMRKQLRLIISANASAPMVCLSEDNTLSPIVAPNFCMSLRKHIGGGKITRIFQPASDISSDEDGLERIIVFAIEHLDEMGDMSTRYLVAELMGKHSNIILLKDDLTIIDSIKHVSGMMSSVREVLPGKSYFIPDTLNKLNPKTLFEDEAAFKRLFTDKEDGMPVYKRLYMSITGFSSVIAHELLYRAGIEPDTPYGRLKEDEVSRLFNELQLLMRDVCDGNFKPNIIYDGDNISEFCALRLKSLEGGELRAKYFDSISEVIRGFYFEKARLSRIRAKSEDIRAVLKILTERASKKLDILEKQYGDTEKKDKYRVYGELLNTYGYELKGGEESLTCQNYYDEGKDIRIPLDKDLSAAQNAKKYFDKYNKLKRTREAVSEQITECRQTLYHLESISSSLMLCESEADLNEIRREMADAGFIRKHAVNRRERKEEKKSKPLHFVSSDGIDIYVGRNNYQNEELDFKLADANDWWFHAKNIAGSHVIAKTGNAELPDKTCLEAAALAAYYSKAGAEGGSGTKIEVDYVKKRELKRVPGAAPGFVIYHTNYSIMIEPRAYIGYN